MVEIKPTSRMHIWRFAAGAVPFDHQVEALASIGLFAARKGTAASDVDEAKVRNQRHVVVAWHQRHPVAAHAEAGA